jgi:predicted NBD/HSP70 family sugar kinase
MQAPLSRYEDRLACALAHVINMVDPDVIVLGGGVSRVERLYHARGLQGSAGRPVSVSGTQRRHSC